MLVNLLRNSHRGVFFLSTPSSIKLETDFLTLSFGRSSFFLVLLLRMWPFRDLSLGKVFNVNYGQDTRGPESTDALSSPGEITEAAQIN